MSADDVLILDNGASTIKAGFASLGDEPRIVSNAIVRSKGDKRMYIGHEIEQCRDFFGLHYRLPFEKGYLTDWDTEKAIWDRLFSEDGMNVDTRQLSLLVTEPYFNLPSIQETYDQLVFEEYEFKSYLRCTPAALIPRGDLFDEPNSRLPPPECMLIVDTGFSFTHVIPIMNDAIIWASVRRIDVGGKLLTNQLKELVSFRQWDMMEQTYIINDIKERCCYVTSSFNQDLETCRGNPKKNPIVQEYVLPDFTTSRQGHIRTESDIIPDRDNPIVYMSNERFSVPELLFNPSDIGQSQAGLPETIAHSISTLPEDLQGLFWANIGLIGGNSTFAGFEQRLLKDLRALAPSEFDISIYKTSNPITQAYRAARSFAQTTSFTKSTVSREEYLEGGSNACRKRFAKWNWREKKPTEEIVVVKEKVADNTPVKKTVSTKGKPRVRSSRTAK